MNTDIDKAQNGPTVCELLFNRRTSYTHILIEIFLFLDSRSLKCLKCASKAMKGFVDDHLWRNKRSKKALKRRLKQA